MKKRWSFTLIELLVVIAIIAILASMLLPALNKARDRARSNKCLGILKDTGTSILQYEADNQDYCPPTKADSPTPTSLTNMDKTSPYKVEWYDVVLAYGTKSMKGITYSSGTKSNIYSFLICPINDGSFDGGDGASDLYGSYGYNHRFSGNKIVKFKFPSRSAMVMDSAYYLFHNYQNSTLQQIAKFAHFAPNVQSGVINMVMADGHATDKMLREFLGTGPYGSSDSGYTKYNLTLDPTRSY